MDLSKLKECLGLDQEELAEILSLFVETTLKDLDALGQAIEAGDPDSVVQCSHSIKGASANLGLEEISSAARAIEMKARRGVLEGAVDGSSFIRDEVVMLREAATGS